MAKNYYFKKLKSTGVFLWSCAFVAHEPILSIAGRSPETFKRHNWPAEAEYRSQ